LGLLAGVDHRHNDAVRPVVQRPLDVVVLVRRHARQGSAAGVGDGGEHVRGRLPVNEGVLDVDRQPGEAGAGEEARGGDAAQRQPGTDGGLTSLEGLLDRIDAHALFSVDVNLGGTAAVGAGVSLAASAAPVQAAAVPRRAGAPPPRPRRGSGGPRTPCWDAAAFPLARVVRTSAVLLPALAPSGRRAGGRQGGLYGARRECSKALTKQPGRPGRWSPTPPPRGCPVWRACGFFFVPFVGALVFSLTVFAGARWPGSGKGRVGFPSGTSLSRTGSTCSICSRRHSCTSRRSTDSSWVRPLLARKC